MAYTLKYQSNNGRTVVLHDNTPKSGRSVGPVWSHQTGLTGINIEFATAQGRIGEEVQGYSIKGKDIVISGDVVGISHQYVLEILHAIVPGVPGKLIYNDQIYLDVEPKQTPNPDQVICHIPFTLVLYAPYPYWKDMQETVIPMERVVKMFKLPTDITTFQLGETNYKAEGNVANGGSVPVAAKAKMVFSGFAANPSVENQTTGERVMVERGFAAGDTLELDATQINITASAFTPGDTFTKLPNPNVLPKGVGHGTAFSPDGTMLAVAHAGSPFITIYRVNSDHTFTKLTNPDVLPTSVARGAAFSPDGTKLAVAWGVAPYITVYRVNSGGTFTKLPDPDVPPEGVGLGVSFTPDGTKLAVMHGGLATGLTLYRVNTDGTLTKVASPDVSLNGGNGLAFSPDGGKLAVAQSGSPYVMLYGVGETTLTKLPNPDVLPSGAGQGVAFSPDGKKLAVAQTGTPFLALYRMDDDALTKLPNPDVLPTNNGNGIAFTPDGNTLAITSNGTPGVILYRVNADGSFTKLSNPDILYPSTAYNLTFSPDGTMLTMGLAVSPYVTTFHSPRAEMDITPLVDINSTILTLNPGQNFIKFNSDQGNDNIKGEIIIRQEHVGALL